MEKRPSVILPTTMASKNGNGQRSEELRRRLCKLPIGSSVKGACSSTHEKLQQQSFLSPTIVDARSITPEEFNKMAAVATGKVTKGSDVSSPQQCEFLQAGQVFLTQNNMNTGFAFASSAPLLTSHVQRYENHPPEAIQQSLASLKKGLVEYLSRAKAAKEKGLTETERSQVAETATKPLAQKPGWRGKPFGCSTKGTAVPAATVKPLPPTTRNDDVVKYHVVSKPQPNPGPRTIHKVPTAELTEIKPIDLSQAGTYNCSDSQASLKEEINDLKEKIVETEKDLQKIGNGKDDGLVSDTIDFSQQEEPIDLTVSKKPNNDVVPVPSPTTDFHNIGKDCSDNITEGKRSLRASTKTNTLATRNSLLQDKNRKRKRKPSIAFHRSGEFGKASANNGLRMMSPGKSGCPSVGKRGRLDEMVQALSKRLDDAYIPSYGIEHR
ncbi:Hypp7408 [Branchiostoma lanceolatum]|uniref:Hypp7408 protein n=1 Tax=Branchiostoma lanceolatum TaxID=7740 RepID=A0A8J9Z059_BRALA|nr:Hypp7408 [Branchiostoma lanceolatum]